MDQSTFEAADPLVDKISELVDQALTSDALGKLRQALSKLSETIGSRYSVGLNVFVDVFDQEQERNLPLLNTGLSCSHALRSLAEEGRQHVLGSRGWQSRRISDSFTHGGVPLGKIGLRTTQFNPSTPPLSTPPHP